MAVKFLEDGDFKAGAMVVIDKPLKWTSFDVVNKIKYKLKHLYGFKKIKVGHAGTLDPLATGVLIVCIGKMTKQIEGLMADKKEYTGKITFGQTTASYDLESEPEGNFPTSQLSLELIREKTKDFMGEITQLPPVFSAKKIDGKRAFDYARKGEEVKMRLNLVEIFEFDIQSFEDNVAEFRVVCSKGTYIRSLANDLGIAAGSGAYLSELRRTASGDYRVEEAITVDEVVDFLEENATQDDQE